MVDVLVFFPHPLSQRHGGPYSALYHLKEGLKEFDNSIDFLSDIIPFKQHPYQEKKTSLIKKLLKPFIPENWIYNRRLYKWLNNAKCIDPAIINNIEVKNYKVLHFHETIDVWRYKSLLKSFKGKVVLTSHSPKPYHLELIEDVMRLKKKQLNKNIYQKLEQIDRFAYDHADVLVFPCREAMEPYEHLWPDFKEIIKFKSVTFLPTGVIKTVPTLSQTEVRQNLSIPNDAFIASYVGRKVEVKGFDLLIELAKEVLPAFPDVYFLIVGKKESGLHFKHDRWIETGWSDEPFNFIEAGNIHLIPNRQSNFDLNLLEVLALGKPLLLSFTGGNKFFSKFESTGIRFHKPDLNDFYNQFMYCYHHQHHMAGSGNNNKTIYEDHLTANRYGKLSIQFYEELINSA